MSGSDDLYAPLAGIRLIGLTGPAGCGKSAVAEALVREGWHRYRFAGPLKSAALALFPEWTWEHVDGALKDLPAPGYGDRSPRELMQRLGTEWGRALDSDLWVRLLRWQLAPHEYPGHYVVVDDVRFANEARAIRAWGGTLVHVLRLESDLPHVRAHASEAGVAFESGRDRTLANYGGLAELQRAAAALGAEVWG